MHGREILETHLREHEGLRARLEEWEAALGQTAGGDYHQTQQALRALRSLCRFFQHEGWHHFREEETVVYPAAEYRVPRLRGLVWELRHEHDMVRRALEEFRRELLYFNATGELRHLPQLGRDLVRLLRQHMEREERELHPVVLKEFSEEDWRALRRLFVEAQVV